LNKITVHKNENFTVLDNRPSQNRNLSWKAKGLLTYLLTLPSDWDVKLSDLENRSTDGRDSTNAGIKELIEAGYITRVPIKENGKFMGYDYSVSETPPAPGKKEPERVFRNGSPATENPTLLSTPEPRTEKQTKKEEFPQDSPPVVLATLLLTEHRKIDEKFLVGKETASVQRWAADIDKLLRLDRRTVDEVRRVIVWCQSEQSRGSGTFWWATNILSGATLREKFPKLWAQATMRAAPTTKKQFGFDHFDPAKEVPDEIRM